MTRHRRDAGLGPAVALTALFVAIAMTALSCGPAVPIPQAAPPATSPDPAAPASASPNPSTAPSPAATPPLTADHPRPAFRPHVGLAEANERGPIVGIWGGGFQPGSVDATSIDLTAEYDVTLALDFGSRAFRVESAMTVRNDSADPIDRLELNTIAARLGKMTLGAVSVAGKPVSATVSDQTITVPLGGVLGRGASVQVKVAYTATLRSDLAGSNWLFTRTNGIVDAHRWIPWVSKATSFDRPNHGDPFVTPVSPRVRVAITADRALVIATTGERVAASGLRQTFEARDVRDFVFSAAPDYSTISTKTADGETTIRVFSRPGFPASSVLAAAKRAIERMEALVGAYPYPTYDLAQTAGGYGMEAPGLTWIPSGVGSGNLAYLVTHETAHQWFYGIVGADQAAEPFTDEAAADFLARYVLGSRRGSNCSTGRLDLSIYRYSSGCYYEVIYIQGGNFLDDIRKAMGTTAFWRGIRAYLAEQRFEIATTKSLLDTLDAATTLDLVGRYEPRFPRLY